MPLDVLLVDDRPANLQALAAVLEGPDVQLHTAGGGAEALRAMRTHDFAVVLLDVQMPDLDGFEVARLMRARRRTRSTPIIFVTGIEQPPDSVFAGYEAGAVDFLVKPLDPVIVRSKVQVFLELHRQRLLVVQQAGELAERVRHNVDGLLVPPGDSAALRAALLTLAPDRERLVQLSLGIQPVRTIAAHVDEIEALYRRAVYGH